VRWLPFSLAGLLALAAAAAIVLGARACDARNPTSVVLGSETYAVQSHVEGEAMYVDLVRDGHVAQSLAGSLDTMCDPPLSALFDVDSDGAPDLYFENCRGHGYVTQRARELTYVNLGDGPRPGGWWARQVFGGGKRLLAIGIGLALGAVVVLAIAGMLLSPRRRP